MTKNQKREYNSLSLSEKKIYDSVMLNFPDTSHDSALDASWQGGVRFQFVPS